MAREQEMANLTDELEDSYKNRQHFEQTLRASVAEERAANEAFIAENRAFVGKLFEDVHEELDEFHKAQKKMHQDLGHRLTRDREDRIVDITSFVNDLHSHREDDTKNLKQQLSDFRADFQQMAEEAKKNRLDECRQRAGEVKDFLKACRANEQQMVKEQRHELGEFNKALRQEVAQDLAELAKETHEVKRDWENFSKRMRTHRKKAAA